uniref:Uncharacterized protein n=1 Tax=Phenylobacterium glaciei TaxID=2803784 RepID=A0A974P2D7_9CAUL|nr:hypothetical protein JKL49_20945 [Phenylobacterium glaciei]
MQSSPARSRTRKSVWLAGSALVIGLVSGVPAWAADAEAGSVKIDPENADYGTRVEELVVTGPTSPPPRPR